MVTVVSLDSFKKGLDKFMEKKGINGYHYGCLRTTFGLERDRIPPKPISQRKSQAVDENKPEVMMKKREYTVYFLIFLILILLILIIVLAVCIGKLKSSPTDQCPSCADPCPQGWVLSKKLPTDQCPSCAIPCPQDWVLHEAYCYYFSHAEATWNASQNNCSSQGGSLTAIDTPSEMKFLLTKKEDTDYWIGLWREEEQPWKWSNGSDFNSWFPIGADGQCAYLNDRNASSSWCESIRGWICRKPRH